MVLEEEMNKRIINYSINSFKSRPICKEPVLEPFIKIKTNTQIKYGRGWQQTLCKKSNFYKLLKFFRKSYLASSKPYTCLSYISFQFAKAFKEHYNY